MGSKVTHDRHARRDRFVRRPCDLVIEAMTRRKFRTRALVLGILTMLSVAAPAQDRGEAFRRIRIGDADGFGFAATTGLYRPIRGIGPGPADSDGDGVLRTGEFLPDLNGDGAVWWLGACPSNHHGLRRQSSALGLEGGAPRCLGIASGGRRRPKAEDWRPSRFKEGGLTRERRVPRRERGSRT